MSETITMPKTPDTHYAQEVKEADVSPAAKALDAEVLQFLRSPYTIESVRYYQFSKEVGMASIFKNVQNQMAEKSIKRATYSWAEPGLDLIDAYPQGKSAFVVAMPKGTQSGAEKFVGYYALKPVK